jgi:predicted cupin superfamily sugar epimerase
MVDGATPLTGSPIGYTLVSCTVAPPFRFDAFELTPQSPIGDW